MKFNFSFRGGDMSAPKMKQRMQRGFTLVELLIVTIILAILAAIVVPQFSAATTDAQEGALDANLSAVRSAIELYRVQHGGNYPGAVAATGATCPSSGTAGAGLVGTSQAMLDQLGMFTDASGKACSTSDGTFRFGPYLRKGMPNNPVTQKGAVATEIATTTTGAPIVATAGGGWAYDTKSGQLIANDTANDGKGKAFSTH